MEAEVRLDCSNQLCPMPIVRAKQEIMKMVAGQVLEIVATDPGFPSDVKAFCAATGNELLALEEAAGKFRAYVRKQAE